MDNNKTIEQIASTHLGQSGSYAVYTTEVDPTLLVALPRQLARQEAGINMSTTNMSGVDVWHCHEMTCLLNSGLPIAGTLKIVYPSSSKYMVESKSLKLYTNTFDQAKMGETIEEAIQSMELQVKQDLSLLLETHDVQVTFHRTLENLKSLPFIDYDDLYELLS